MGSFASAVQPTASTSCSALASRSITPTEAPQMTRGELMALFIACPLDLSDDLKASLAQKLIESQAKDAVAPLDDL
jgi:hypothetical protein